MTKIRITMKTPDAVHYACFEEATNEIDRLTCTLSYSHPITGDDYLGYGDEMIDDEERSQRIRDLTEHYTEYANTWFTYGECVTLEIDTETNTCRVCPK